MEDPKNGRPPGDEPVGQHIAAEMLKNIVRLNENIEKSHQLYSRLDDSLASLCDYHETWMRAAEILIEKNDEGKVKWSVRDFALALAEAAEEVMGEEEEDEPGSEDPLVPGRHR